MASDHKDYAPWLRLLAQKGGKGVVNNIDARSMGRIAGVLDAREATIAALRAEVEDNLLLYREAQQRADQWSADNASLRADAQAMREVVEAARRVVCMNPSATAAHYQALRNTLAALPSPPEAESHDR